MISLRFYYHPPTFLNSILHPTESLCALNLAAVSAKLECANDSLLVIPASVISIGTILLNITQYGLADHKSGRWLLCTMCVLFWIYCGLAVLFSAGIYLVL